jgi:hypothetical protein
MPKEEYLDTLTTKMRRWRERIDEGHDSELEGKYERVIGLITMYERLGACAWREEERALDQACSQLEDALSRQ